MCFILSLFVAKILRTGNRLLQITYMNVKFCFVIAFDKHPLDNYCYQFARRRMRSNEGSQENAAQSPQQNQQATIDE